jgi:NAD(P)-dependent dehydrogenase (short-subunit alcohol dehydrogenase family)
VKPADFAGKQVYVVGGSLGIGLAIAKRVAALGAHVTIFARRKEPLAHAVAAVSAARQQAQQRIAARQVDVRDHAQVLGTLTRTVSEIGPPDVLINCAGRAQPRRFEDVSYEQFSDTLRVNLHGSWSTVQAVLPYMKTGGGYIVNTASIAGLIGIFGYTDYSASKFGLVGFSEALRCELKAYDISVSVLCPPDTDTPGLLAENQTKPEETRAIAAGAKIMSPDAVAEALIRGMARRSFLIIPGVEGRLGVLAKRLLPGLVERIIDRTVRQVARRRATARRE